MIASCSKPPSPESAVVAEATPAITPHPASGATEAAIQKYPALAVKDSTFNKTFRELFEDQMRRNPIYLTRPEWPLDLAQRTAELLNVAPYTPEPKIVASTPYPVPTPITPAPTPTALNRGAYDKSHIRSSWVDQYGVRHYSY